MPKRSSTSGSELFIVDNSDQDWKVQRYLHDWCQISRAIDIATGFFEIGSLLSLQDEWKKVDKIRILMGDEVSKRTRKAFEHGLRVMTGRLDSSLESEKEKNDFLQGVPAIVDAIRSGKIECRVYRKEKFHAKAYITHARLEVVGASALVGSSNFTFPGLMENIELNVQITGGPVTVLQEWYEEHWSQAEDVTPEILRTIDRHIREYLPFDVYIKSLHEFFRGHSVTAREWEETVSQMYPILDQYQKDGYHAVMDIADNYGGSFLCDGVGLGKTFVGLMLLERFVMYDRKRVALFVPKSARTDVWERDLRRYLPHIGGTRGGDFSSLAIFNHTDLGREGDFPYRFERIKEMADVILIDEAHHFRNPGIMGRGEKRPSRYRELFDLMGSNNGPKQLFMLTATPVNNTLHDLRHMIELFSRGQEDFFRNTLGIHSLRGHFITMERQLRQTVTGNDKVTPDTNLVEAGQVLTGDSLFRALVVQRSRAHVKRSQALYGGNLAMFPEREIPKVVAYSVRKTYGRLLEIMEKAFARAKPLFALGIYYPLAYYKGSDDSIDALTENRQKQVVSLIRTQFLKRFESSAEAFGLSCHRLFLKLLIWATRHSITDGEKARLKRWMEQHSELIRYVQQRQNELGDVPEDEAEDDLISEEMLATVNELSREEYDVQGILADTFLD
ncbi:MAG: phospholipase D-like domain-containing protein, partial [Syntrophobacteraceae bacterium]